MNADTITTFEETILEFLQDTFDIACSFGQMTYTSVEVISQEIQSDRRGLGQVGRQLQTSGNYVKTSTSSHGPPPTPCMECISSDALDFKDRRHLFVIDPSEIGHKRKMQNDESSLETILNLLKENSGSGSYWTDVTGIDVENVGVGVYTISDVTEQPSLQPSLAPTTTAA